MIDGLLLDIDGVLAVSWQALPGSVETMAWLRSEEVPFRLITNTTTHTRRELAATLADAGFDAAAEEIVTAVVATAAHLRREHRDAGVFVLTDGEPGEDLDGVRRVAQPEDADVVVLGGACDAFTYDLVNRIFRRVKDGAALVGMHRNLYWRTAAGWELDGGAYVAGLEEAAGVRAEICGKPSRAYFEAALALLGLPPERVAMVGDDIANDVLGAQAAGITGVLVRTGKFQEDDLRKGVPDVVLGSLADVPGWLRGG
ncbi:MAG: HAD-IIA family hydrolase [Planctomycetaceae bacterium]